MRKLQIKKQLHLCKDIQFSDKIKHKINSIKKQNKQTIAKCITKAIDLPMLITDIEQQKTKK